MTSPNGKHVWLVDDEEDVLTYLRTALEDEDLGVQGFVSADGIVQEARQAAPDLFCLDIMMPNQSGLSLYRELRTEGGLRNIPIVIVSGYSGEKEFLEREFGELMADPSIPRPDGFVEKPVDIQSFVRLVRSLLEDE